MPAEMNLEEIEVKANTKLSNMDKAFMVINYPFRNTTGWTLSYALGIAGVTEPTKSNILKATDADEIRQQFSVWTATQRARELAARPNGNNGNGSAGTTTQPGRGRDLDRGSAGHDTDAGLPRNPTGSSAVGGVSGHGTSTGHWTNPYDGYRTSYPVQGGHHQEQSGRNEVAIGSHRSLSNQSGPARALSDEQALINWDFCATEDYVPTEERHREIREGDHGPARGLAPQQELLWQPGDIITYWFQQSDYRADTPQDPNRSIRRQVLLRAFDRWSAVSRLQFITAQGESNASVRIWFHEDVVGPYKALSTFKPNRSWTEIGTRNKVRDRPDKLDGGYKSTSMYLKLPEFSRGTFEEALATRICLHETGHILGLRHEAGSPRSKQAKFEYAPSAEYVPMFWTEWDPKSIMLYPGKALLSTSTANPGITKANMELSKGDEAFVTVSVSFQLIEPS